MAVEIVITIFLTIAFAFGIGSGDETLSTLVGTGGMRLRHAIILGSICAAIGAFFLSTGVADSIGTGIINENVVDLSRFQTWIMISILISVTGWLYIASWTGLPVSTTYCIIGGFLGIVLCAPLLGTDVTAILRWSAMQEIIIGMIISPFLGLIFSIIIAQVMKHLVRRRIHGLASLEKTEGIFMGILVFFALFNELNRSGNDAGKALGIFYGLFVGGQIDAAMLCMMLVIGSIAVGSGLFIVGRKLVKNVGKNIVEIRPSDAVCIEASTSIVLLLANILALPISGGQVLVFSILGMAMTKHQPVNKKKFKRIIYSWIITFPIAALSTAAIFSLLIVTVKF